MTRPLPKARFERTGLICLPSTATIGTGSAGRVPVLEERGDSGPLLDTLQKLARRMDDSLRKIERSLEGTAARPDPLELRWSLAKCSEVTQLRIEGYF